MTKYRGVVTLAANTRSTNVAELTPFRQMIRGEMLECRVRQLDGVALGTAPTATAELAIGRTVLFSGQVNQNLTNATNQAATLNRAGLDDSDLLYRGPLPVGGTLSLSFTGTAVGNVLWELGGEVQG